jgi:hypothetical protein
VTERHAAPVHPVIAPRFSRTQQDARQGRCAGTTGPINPATTVATVALLRLSRGSRLRSRRSRPRVASRRREPQRPGSL